MEDGLGPRQFVPLARTGPNVLILVLMEDGLGQKECKEKGSGLWVLILVLMEDGLGLSRVRYETFSTS